MQFIVAYALVQSSYNNTNCLKVNIQLILSGNLTMIETIGLTKIFQSGKKKVIALNEIDLLIEPNRFVLIKGPSGCGKSSLLFCMGGMLKPSSGDIRINNVSLFEMNGKKRAKYRSHHIGFVFQSYHLLPYLTVLENIIISRRLYKDENIISVKKAVEIAESLRIKDRLHHKPSELSVGEKQRVALARAFISNPKIIFADEPTGNLDHENTKEVINQLSRFHNNGGTVIMASHTNEADPVADMHLNMKGGKIIT